MNMNVIRNDIPLLHLYVNAQLTPALLEGGMNIIVAFSQRDCLGMNAALTHGGFFIQKVEEDILITVGSSEVDAHWPAFYLI